RKGILGTRGPDCRGDPPFAGPPHVGPMSPAKLLRAFASPGAQTAPSTGKPKLAYVDCLRGYAILLVIVCHTVDYAYPNLPYPARRLGVFGWYGVQLFFM